MRLLSRVVISAAFFLLVGIFYYVSSLEYYLYVQVGGVEKPGPGLVPRGLAVAIILCSLVILAASLVRGRIRAEPGFTAIFEDLGLARRNLVSTALLLLSIVFYLLVVDLAGFLATSIVVLVFMLRALGEKRWWFSVSLGAGSGFLTYWLFWTLMRVPLPTGTLWE